MVTKFFQWSVSLVVALVTSSNVAIARDSVPYIDIVQARIFNTEVNGGTATLPFEVVRGLGTPLGFFTTLGVLEADLTTLQFNGTNTFVTAEGDAVYAEIVGGLFPTHSATRFIITVQTSFVGGTGAYNNAKGGFVGIGLLNLPSPGQFEGATFIGIGNGTISKPKKANKK